MRYIDLRQETKLSKRTPNLTRYLQEINQYDLLTAEQEVELAVKIKQGDQKALNTLVNSNLKFVVSVAKQYQHQGVALLDLINEGNLGLIKAAEKFDHTRGFKFISYAVWWVRQHISTHLKQSLVKLPQSVYKDYCKLLNVIKNLQNLLQRPPTTYELAEELGWDVCRVLSVQNMSSRAKSLDEPVSNHVDGNLKGVDLLKAVTKNSTEDLDRQFVNKFVLKKLEKLNDSRTQIIVRLYGLDGKDPDSIYKLASDFSVCNDTIRDWTKRLLRRLRIGLNSEEKKALQEFLQK